MVCNVIHYLQEKLRFFSQIIQLVYSNNPNYPNSKPRVNLNNTLVVDALLKYVNDMTSKILFSQWLGSLLQPQYQTKNGVWLVRISAGLYTLLYQQIYSIYFLKSYF